MLPIIQQTKKNNTKKFISHLSIFALFSIITTITILFSGCKKDEAKKEKLKLDNSSSKAVIQTFFNALEAKNYDIFEKTFYPTYVKDDKYKGVCKGIYDELYEILEEDYAHNKVSSFKIKKLTLGDAMEFDNDQLQDLNDSFSSETGYKEFTYSAVYEGTLDITIDNKNYSIPFVACTCECDGVYYIIEIKLQQ